MEKSNETELVDIRQIPEIYRAIFAAYPSFNRVQSKLFNDVFDTDHSVVLSAPTGSGKTVIFELAIIRQLIAAEKSKYSNIFKIIYISPMKALCEERLIDWHKKFSPFGINCISVTGDSDFIDFHSLSNHNLIITTPEKWDSITRKWKENKQMIQVIKLFMIDEIHLLNEENRGATLEALVCRMKTIQSSLFDGVEENVLNSRQNIRFLAVSATFPNIKDVSDWLGAKCYSFESSSRPVRLNTIVLGFTYNRSSTMFRFDISLNYRLPTLILKYSKGKPTLIFCSTRKSVEMTVKHLIQNLTIPLSDNQKDLLIKSASSITDTKLREGIFHGIGYHHGGLLPETRSIIEQLFRNGQLPVLVTTSTLATGVNLPAHLVIIKSTKFYNQGGFQDYPASAVLQMIGRAGRPQFDTEATALILTSTTDKAKFEKMIDGKENIESNLHRHLTEHLNAEIVLRTITDLDVAMRWLSSTFLYIRARRNPRHYGIPMGMATDKIDKKLLEICQIDLNKLVKAGMASMDEDVNISPTFLGTLMAKFYISFESMKLLKSMNGNELLQQILSLISKSKEFSDMRLRVDEKKCLNLLNKTKNENSIRFPFNGKINTSDMKINCIIQAIFGSLEIDDQSIICEAFRIMRLGERICRCLIEYLESRENCYTALLNATVLWKCFRTQLWENSKHIAKQFPGIGQVTSKQLVNAGKTSLEKIIKTNPRELEMITNKKPPFGNKLVELAKSIPRYEMKIENCPSSTSFSLKITITLLNAEFLEEATFVHANSVMCLLVGNNLNQILLHERYMHSYILENNEVVRFVELNTSLPGLSEVYCNFVSENLVGIDLSETFIIREQHVEKQKNLQRQVVKPAKASKTSSKSIQSTEKLDPKYSSFVQTYIDKYMKCKKNTNSPTEIEQDDVKNPSASKNVTIPEKNEVIPQKINPSSQQSKTVIFEKPKKSYNKYSLSQFDETIIDNVSVNKDEESTRNDENPPLKSFTDEEMLESVEFLLDQDGIMSDTDEMLKSKNVASTLTTELASADLDIEFSRLYDKYKNTKNSISNENNTHLEKMNNKPNSIGRIEMEKCIRKPELGISKKGKLHSVSSFENKLFNPKTDTLSLFRYQPTKRLVHSSRNSDPPSAPECKRKKIDASDEKVTEDMMENLEKFINQNEKESLQYSKSIKWRSPLVYSPPVKFSPKMSSSFSFSVPMPKNDSENSHDWSMNTVDTNNSSKTAVTHLARTTPETSKNESQLRKNNQGTKFQLSDRGYNQAELEKPLNNTLQNIPVMQTPKKSRQIQDFFSSSFLEDVGYAERPKITSNLRCSSQRSQDPNTSIRSAGSYYHDMVAKEMDARKHSESSRQISQKPFFLSQNHLTLTDNTLGNKTNYISSNNQLMSQQVNRRSYVPYKEDQLEIRAPNVELPTRGFNTLDLPWLGSQTQNMLPANVPRLEYDSIAGNVLNTSIQNAGNRLMWPRSLPPEYTDQNRPFAFNFHQGANYPVGLDNRGVYPTIANDPFEQRSSLGNNFLDNHLRQPKIPRTFPDTMAEQNYNSRMNPYSSDLDNFIDKDLLMTVQNCNANPNGNPLQTLPRSFFLNPPNRIFDGPQVTPCEIHRIFNCSYCSKQHYTPQPNDGSASQNEFAIHKYASGNPSRPSEDANRIYDGLKVTPCEIHRIFNCSYCSNQHYTLQPRSANQNEFTIHKYASGNHLRASEDIQRGADLSNGYFNNPPSVPFGHPFLERNRQDIPSIGDDRMQSSFAMQNYGLSTHRLPQYGSNFQNTFGVQNMNIPGEMTYHNYPTTKNDNEEQTTQRENKTFMISKFLNSFDDGSKNQE